MKARLGAVGVLSLADHAYAKVEAVDVGDRDGYDQSPMNDALELVRVRFGPGPYGGFANMLLL